MYTKIQFAMLVLLSVIVMFGVMIYRGGDELAAKSDQTALSFASQSGQIAQLEAQASGVSGTWTATGELSAQTAQNLSDTSNVLTGIISFAEMEKLLAAQQAEQVNALVTASATHVKNTKDALDSVLSTILGDPIGQTFGQRATIKVFSLEEAGYRGYMAKIKLHDPAAVRLVLSHDKIGDKGETTSQAAKRTGAALAVNGGGFAIEKGLLYPMGITVVDGEIRTWASIDLSFIGFNDQGRLVGGEITSKDQIEALKIQQGATFVPTLLQDGKKLDIPKRYQNQKQPRTLIGHFSNGDILMIVIDGRDKGYSDGITLENAQDKLLEFNVKNAYNLDGGGSSTFYYNGKVLNKPSDGRERAVVSSFVIMK